MKRALILAIITGTLLGLAAPTRTMELCAEEDGSDKPGVVCIWTDPDTGRQYVNNTEKGH